MSCMPLEGTKCKGETAEENPIALERGIIGIPVPQRQAAQGDVACPVDKQEA